MSHGNYQHILYIRTMYKVIEKHENIVFGKISQSEVFKESKLVCVLTYHELFN